MTLPPKDTCCFTPIQLNGRRNAKSAKPRKLPWLCPAHELMSEVVSLLLLCTGVVLISNDADPEGQVCEFVALVFGLPFIVFEALVSLSKCQIDMAALVLIAAAGAVAQGEATDAALVVAPWQDCSRPAQLRRGSQRRADASLVTTHKMSLSSSGAEVLFNLAKVLEATAMNRVSRSLRAAARQSRRRA